MQMIGRRNVTWRIPSISADGLKNFACIIMLLETFGATVIERGLINLDQYTQTGLSEALAEDSQLMMYAGIGSVMQLLGGLAVPIFAFLLVEGFLYTSSYKKYVLTIAFFALISEIPYDFANSGKFIDWSSQNAMVALCVSLLMLYFIKMFQEKGGFLCQAGELLIVVCAVAWVAIFRSQYGLCTVLLTAIFYFFRSRGVIRTVLGIIVSLLYVTGPIAFYFIWLYSGERKDKLPKYAYYILYPAQLLFFGIVTKLIS